MKFFIVILAAVAVCAASRQVSVNEDGTISIVGENGRQVLISPARGQNGQRVIEVAGRGNSPAKRIEINDSNNLSEQEQQNFEQNRPARGANYNNQDQADVLAEIFNQYQGQLNEASYQNLLNEVESAAQNGRVSQAVYEALRNFEYQGSNQSQNQLQALLNRYSYNRPSYYNYYPSASFQQYYNRYFGRYNNNNGQEQFSYEQIVGLDSNGRQIVAVDNNGRRAIFQQTPNGLEVYYPESNQR